MSAPYICKKCGKEMWSFNDVVEYWDDIYCKHCAENPVTEQRPVKKKPIPMKSDVAAVNYREDSIREDKEAVHIKGQRNEAAIYKKGDFIGQKYEVFDVLGMGGFGIVYLVYDHGEIKTTIALKTFRNEYLKDSHAIERFKKEAKIWVDLDIHPFIVFALIVLLIEERVFIAMQYIAPNEAGLNSLDGYLKHQPPDLVQSLRWAIQFCHGMEYAYSKGIKAHRDIKPANIMITRDKILKISDFGLAGVIGESKAISGIKVGIQQNKVGFSYQTMDGVGFGTPTHMPPEQFTNAAGCDERSDIYSFGVVLYQMATGGQLPFLAPLPQNDSYEESRRFWIEMYKLHAQATIPKLNSPLSPIIQKCLEKRPQKRYQSFEKLRAELEPILKKLSGEVIKLTEEREVKKGDWVLKGISLINLERYQEAITYFDKALKIDPSFTDAWDLKGYTLMLTGNYQKAIACFDMVININNNDSNAFHAFHWKGAVLGELSKYEEAITCIDKAIEINPKDADIWNTKGLVLGKLSRREEAIACFDRALKINPARAETWSNMGAVLDGLGKSQEAIACYEKALKIDPMDADAWYNKGVVLAKIAEVQYSKGVILEKIVDIYKEAISCYDKAIEINPMDAEVWFNKGNALGGMGNAVEAIICYDHVLEIDPMHFKALYHKAFMADMLGRRHDAILSYKRFLELAPADPSKQIEKARKRLRELEGK